MVHCYYMWARVSIKHCEEWDGKCVIPLLAGDRCEGTVQVIKFILCTLHAAPVPVRQNGKNYSMKNLQHVIVGD